MKVLRCPHCGGMSPSATGEPGVFFCGFCNARFHDAPPAPQPAPVLVVRSRGGGGGGLMLVAAAGGLVLVGGIVVAMMLVRKGPATPPPKGAKVEVAAKPVAKPEVEAAPPPAEKTKSILWASTRAFPIGADVDGDGTEDLVGPTIKQDGANAQLWVSAFDGKKLVERWSVGPFGAPQKGKDVDRELQVAVGGKRVVVLDPKGDAHLYELDSGKLVGDFPFREEHRGMCGPPGLEPKVLVRVGKGDFVIDTATGKGANGAPPPWCAGDKYMRRRPSESYNSYFGAQSEKLQDIGFTRERLAALQVPPKATLSFAFADGPLTVGVGTVKGSDEPMLYGFDAKGASTFQVAGSGLGLDRLDRRKDLAFGRFVFVTAADQLVSVDAKTGEKQWSTLIEASRRRQVDRIAITQSRVWLSRRLEPGGSSGFVEAYDAQNGKRLASTMD